MRKEKVIKSSFLDRLDKFGPWGSALGALSGITLAVYLIMTAYHALPLLTDLNKVYHHYIILVCISTAFGYIFCTCTHRLYLVYSPGAIGGAIGTIVGCSAHSSVVYFLLCEVQRLPKLAGPSGIALFIIGYTVCGLFILPPLGAFFFSRFMCRIAKRLEISKSERVR